MTELERIAREYFPHECEMFDRDIEILNNPLNPNPREIKLLDRFNISNLIQLLLIEKISKLSEVLVCK